MAWTASSATSQSWQQLSQVTDAGNDWDFRLKASEQFPMKAYSNSFKALKARNSAFTEGV